MRRASFDFERFSADINATRDSRGLTWRRVGEESGVPASTFTRINKGDGRKPDVNNLAAIANWAGLNLDDYVRDRVQVLRSHLEQITGLILSDPHLVESERQALAQVVRLWYQRPSEPVMGGLDRALCPSFMVCADSDPHGCVCLQAFAPKDSLQPEQ